MNLHRCRKVFWLLAIIPIVIGGLSGCSRGSASSNQGELAMAPMESMPAEVQAAPTTVQQAYQFAFANPDVLSQIPCYCGCDDIGHRSNYDCYVSGVETTGKVNYDAHALGCSICVDITQDTMRLLTQGKPVPEIKAYIDQNYSQYGPSNMP